MRHDWIFDVLSDLRTYALQNNLPALAAKVDEALVLAKAEIEAEEAGEGGPGGHGGSQGSGRAH